MCFQVLAYMGCEKQILLADVFVIERSRGYMYHRKAYHPRLAFFFLFFSSGYEVHRVRYLAQHNFKKQSVCWFSPDL